MKLARLAVESAPGNPAALKRVILLPTSVAAPCKEPPVLFGVRLVVFFRRVGADHCQPKSSASCKQPICLTLSDVLRALLAKEYAVRSCVFWPWREPGDLSGARLLPLLGQIGRLLPAVWYEPGLAVAEGDRVAMPWREPGDLSGARLLPLLGQIGRLLPAVWYEPGLAVAEGDRVAMQGRTRRGDAPQVVVDLFRIEGGRFRRSLRFAVDQHLKQRGQGPNY